MTSYECGVKGARAGHSSNSSHAFQPGHAGSIWSSHSTGGSNHYKTFYCFFFSPVTWPGIARYVLEKQGNWTGGSLNQQMIIVNVERKSNRRERKFHSITWVFSMAWLVIFKYSGPCSTAVFELLRSGIIWAAKHANISNQTDTETKIASQLLLTFVYFFLSIFLIRSILSSNLKNLQI